MDWKKKAGDRGGREDMRNAFRSNSIARRGDGMLRLRQSGKGDI
jgi:hypothetical protein